MEKANNDKADVTSRFFIVSYVAGNTIGGHNIGDTTFETDGEFINRKKTVEQIKSLNEKFSDKIVITSILEVNKKDYDEWLEER